MDCSALIHDDITQNLMLQIGPLVSGTAAYLQPWCCRPLLPFAVREKLAANIQKAERGEESEEEGPLASHVRKSIEEHKEEYRAILKK